MFFITSIQNLVTFFSLENIPRQYCWSKNFNCKIELSQT